eukprot:CAMPEP_0204212908 /NCGR_PEP_ID=MMETSP0361-20130328/75596_1 /ASSEMBLY_ACC=CAM_ASM_000343 /TAXON_ID=268821 /ORGANISM="Scrippsiella Hangoei, Strain SHTV-5" /LENGTH=79 /DNA_ID=CAMNT_0051177303 /DNA_START=144 /DNA_END=383 /DNA_ORIENTATION=+
MIALATCMSSKPNFFKHCTLGFRLFSRLQPPSRHGNLTTTLATWESSMPKPFNHSAIGFMCSSGLLPNNAGNFETALAT